MSFKKQEITSKKVEEKVEKKVEEIKKEEVKIVEEVKKEEVKEVETGGKKSLSFEDKMKKIKDAVGQRYGRGKIVRGEEIAKKEITRVPIYKPIDNILGGGIPQGRIVEIYGKESVGKTSLCFIIIREFQKLGHRVAYIEVDNGLDIESMKKFGVNVDELHLVQPESCEEALDCLDAFVRTREFGLIVLDCLAMLSPAAEIEGSMEDNQMAVLARQINKALRKVHSGLQAEDLRNIKSYNDVSVVFVNQIRTKLNVSWGSPESLPGGEGHKYSASIQIKVSRVEDLKDNDENTIGIKSKLETKKNKTYYPHKECIVSISHRDGDFYQAGDIFKTLLDREVFVKVKGWIKFQGNSYRENEILDMLEKNKEFLEKMKQLI